MPARKIGWRQRNGNALKNRHSFICFVASSIWVSVACACFFSDKHLSWFALNKILPCEQGQNQTCWYLYIVTANWSVKLICAEPWWSDSFSLKGKWYFRAFQGFHHSISFSSFLANYTKVIQLQLSKQKSVEYCLTVLRVLNLSQHRNLL